VIVALPGERKMEREKKENSEAHKRLHTLHQGCQMVYFQTKNPNLGIFGGFGMGNVGIFSGHLDYFKAKWVYFMTTW
jgi:hypothetical protein